MFGISASAMIIIAVAILVPSVGWWYDSNELKVCKAEYETFQSNTQREGEKSDHQRKETETNLANAAVAIQGDLNAQYADNAKLYADNERLRRLNKGDPGRGGASPLAEAAERFSCPDRGAELAAALERLEVGILPILESRDKAIIRTIACKKYIEDLQSIMNKEQP